MTTEALMSPDPFPIFTSSPNSDVPSGEVSTSPLSILRSGVALWFTPHINSALSQFVSLLPYSSSYKNMEMVIRRYLSERIGGQLIQLVNVSSKYVENYNIPKPEKTLNIGKLGLLAEAAGKVRVFAMVDCFTQWALKPLHKWLFSVLRRHPDIDGTFNQMHPLSRVPFDGTSLFSFDLSAATDRLPVSLQEKILSVCFGKEFSSLWRTILVGRTYFVRYKSVSGKTESNNLSYAVGQPMGALSSWAMLALTHHFIVQCSAWISGITPKTVLFKDYAVLGDDIVI